MEAASLGRTPPWSGPVQVALVASLLVAAAGAWAVTGDRMGGMDAGPGSELGGLGWFAVVWVTMMAAMMLPSIAPMVLAQARVQIGATPVFVAGYLLTWGGGRHAQLGACGGGAVAGPRPPRLGRGGTVRRGRDDPRRGRLPAQPAEEPQPAPLPQPARVRLRALAARSRRRCAHRNRARSGVRGL
jgi:Predicted metal-binding integral membrane protein (DUF2182)